MAQRAGQLLTKTGGRSRAGEVAHDRGGWTAAAVKAAGRYLDDADRGRPDHENR